MAAHRHPLWHPFADMAHVPGRELTLVSGEGARLTDAAGAEYLDATASLWFCNAGYGRTELAEAAAEQMRRLPAYNLFGNFTNPAASELAERLAALAPMDEAAVFFTSGGSDAIDTACKMARRYWQLRGCPERTLVIARSEAYHGMNAFGTTLAGIERNRVGWGPLVADVVHVPFDDASAVERALRQHRGRVAAFVGEPIVGAGGVLPPTPTYWADVQRACRAHEVLVIADEVVTGFGRTGPWFASERYAIEPDLVTGAKGVTSGYLPLGVVLCGPRVLDVMWAPDAGPFLHGYTYSGHAAACAVALRNLEIVEREGLRTRVAELEPVLADAIHGLAGAPLVVATRAAGLLAAVELDADARALHPDLMDRVVDAARARGVLIRGLVGRAIQISPPFVVDEQDLRTIADVVREALETVAGQLGLVETAHAVHDR